MSRRERARIEDRHFGDGVDTLGSRGVENLPGHVDTIRGMPPRSTFDFSGFISAVDRERRKKELTWGDLAEALWDQSAALNAHRNDHPL
jgi:hypothetical protein